MDIIKPKLKPRLFSHQQLTVITIVGLIFFLSLFAKRSFNQVSVKRSEIIISRVKQGDLDVIIDGYGELKSAKQQLITASSRAIVIQVLLKPGERVTVDSVILKLENLELMQQLENNNQQLIQAEANLRQLILKQKRESLNESAAISEIVARYETAKLKRRSEGKLINEGVIAKNIYEGSLLNENQLKQRMTLLKNRQRQLVDVHHEAVNIQNEIIKQHQGRARLAQQRVDKLYVKAGLNGVLQSLSVELGQSLVAGQKVALIGSIKELVALIKIPQRQAEYLIIGQKVVIDTRRDKIPGEIVRIDPVVENNTVTVEVSLAKHLPPSARPQANVEAVIIADTLKNVTYIERPINAQANASKALFKVVNNSQEAKLTRLRFGRLAGRYIEILDAVKVGEAFIISDLNDVKEMTNRLILE